MPYERNVINLMQPINIRNLTFAYPGQPPLFDNCQLDFNSNWRLGLLGRNGRGKTTLMNILRGRLDYRGTVTTNLAFNYFPLTINDPTTFADPALLASSADRNLEQWQIERELGLMGVDPALLWQPYQTLSGGEQTKVQLATLFAQTGAFLLLDEPTNHLDQASRQQVANYLVQKQRGFIITSHDQAFLDQVIDHTLVIERHQLVLLQGNYSAYRCQKDRRDEEARANNRQLQAEIKTLKKARQRQAQWAQQAENEKKHNALADKGFIGAKAAKMMKKTVTTTHHLNQAISDRVGLLKDVESVVPLTINYQPDYHQTLLTLNQVAIVIAGHQLFQPVSATLKQHEQVALVGPNGAGKSSLIRVILNHFPGNISGEISHPADLTISYVRQDCTDNHGTLDQFAADFALPYDQLLNILRKLGMARTTFNILIEDMSMGQQKKVELARSLLTPAQLYIWDEPLNYLDTYNQRQLVDLIKEYQPPLLFVEHDRHFITEVASRQVSIVPLDR